MKCYMSCVFQELHLMDGKGNIHFDRLYLRISTLQDEELKATAKAMLDACPVDKVEGKTKCERAFWVNKCLKIADPVV